MPLINKFYIELEKPKFNEFIYGLIDPNTNQIMYVGQTIQGFKRIQEHFSKCNTANPSTNKKSPSKLWISKLKKNQECFKVIYLEYPLQANLNEAEEYWISFFKSTGANLLNYSQNSGYSNTLKSLTAEDRANISNATKEAMNNPETRRKCRENRARQPAPNIGRKFSQEFKDKISKSQTRVKYIQDSNGNIYRGYKKTALALNTSMSSVWRAVSGTIKDVNGITLIEIKKNKL